MEYGPHGGDEARGALDTLPALEAYINSVEARLSGDDDREAVEAGRRRVFGWRLGSADVWVSGLEGELALARVAFGLRLLAASDPASALPHLARACTMLLANAELLAGLIEREALPRAPPRELAPETSRQLAAECHAAAHAHVARDAEGETHAMTTGVAKHALDCMSPSRASVLPAETYAALVEALALAWCERRFQELKEKEAFDTMHRACEWAACQCMMLCGSSPPALQTLKHRAEVMRDRLGAGSREAVHAVAEACALDSVCPIQSCNQ